MGNRVCLLIPLLVAVTAHATPAAEREGPMQPSGPPQRTNGRNADADDAGRVVLGQPGTGIIKSRLADMLVPIGDEQATLVGSAEPRAVRGSEDPGFLLTRARTAAAGGFTERAIVMFQQLLGMDLEPSATRDKILFEANRQLADLHAETAYKSVHYLSAALRYAPATERARIESRIIGLGGNIFDATFDQVASATSGSLRSHNDCATADPIVPDSGFQTQSPGITAPGTYDWFVFTTTQESFFRIETTPNASSASDDTDLSLYGACPAVAGTCDPSHTSDPACIAFDDDSGPVGFSSLIMTDCLPAGTYYIEVGGWLDFIAVGSYDIRVDAIECPADQPLDQYEPDDTQDNGTSIGQPTSAPPGQSIAWGLVNRQTQKHTIAPAGDRDDVKFSLVRNERVRASVEIQHGSFFNDFEEIGFDAEGEACDWIGFPCDPSIELTYDKSQDWGGLCFNSGGFAGQTCNCPTDIFPGVEPVGGQLCLSSAAAAIRNAEPRCSDPNDPEFPFVNCPYFGTLGGDSCPIPDVASRNDGCYNMQTNVSGDPFSCFGRGASLAPDCPPETLAFNNDRSATDLGSELSFCLPSTTPGTTDPSVNGPWHIRIKGFADQQFEYEVRVTAEASCENFETEPNDRCEDMQEITLGDTIHAMANNSTAQAEIENSNGLFTIPALDSDLFVFNPPSVGRMIFETDSFDPWATDTWITLSIHSGDCEPPGNMLLVFTGDDDGGPGLLSRLEVGPLPPAPDLFGGSSPDAQYVLEVRSAFLQQDYPYTLHTAFETQPLPELEPNDDGENAAPMVVQPGTTVNASIGHGCDFDTFKVPLAADTFVTFETTGFLDTTMQIVDCATTSLVWNSCDDDGGVGTSSSIEGCLPAGDVCVRVRGFSGFATGEYAFKTRVESTGCVASDPPLVTAGRDFTCATVGAFEICP